MPRFNPADTPEPRDNATFEAGKYLLGLAWFQRKWGKDSNRPYLKVRYVVLWGPHKDTSIYTTLGIDIDNQGVANRLALHCRAIGQAEEWETDSDEECYDALVGKSFCGRVKVVKKGQWTNMDIERYEFDMLDKDPDGDAMRTAAAEWEADYADKPTMVRPDDSDSNSGGSEGGYEGGPSSSSNDPPPVADDDIPF